MTPEAWKEQAARVLCEVKGINPDCLHQHNFEGDYPEDERQEYIDSFTGQPRVMLLHKAWRHRVAEAEALYPLVQQAIAAERERCAKVAEDWNIDWARPSGYMPDDIAAAIRSLKEADNGAGNECICPKCGLRHGGKVDSGAVF